MIISDLKRLLGSDCPISNQSVESLTLYGGISQHKLGNIVLKARCKKSCYDLRQKRPDLKSKIWTKASIVAKEGLRSEIVAADRRL